MKVSGQTGAWMMQDKTTVKVLIDGKVYTLGGFESEDYIQKVAYYLNSKTEELKGLSGYSHQTMDVRNLLLALNIADDYFKAKSEVETLEEDRENKDMEAYNAKHDLVSARVKIEELENEIARLKGRHNNNGTTDKKN